MIMFVLHFSFGPQFYIGLMLNLKKSLHLSKLFDNNDNGSIWSEEYHFSFELINV